MNLGLLFNTLGAAIFDGVPEDAEIIVCEDDGSKGEVQSVWLYSNKHTGENQVLIASYGPPSESEAIRVLWVRTPESSVLLGRRK